MQISLNTVKNWEAIGSLVVSESRQRTRWVNGWSTRLKQSFNLGSDEFHSHAPLSSLISRGYATSTGNCESFIHTPYWLRYDLCPKAGAARAVSLR